MGINPWPGYEFLYLAQEKGFFEAEGASIDLVEYGSLGDVARAFQRDQVDGMTSTLVEVLQVCARGDRCPKAVMVTDYSDGADVLLARRGVTSIAGLAGRRVAAEPASLSSYILARALDSHGLTFDDVDVKPLDVNAIPEALREGRVDAAVAYPPVALALRDRPDMRVLFSSADIPGEVVDVVSIDPAVIDSRPADVRGLLRGWARALEYAESNPREAHAIMARRERITPAAFRQSLNGLDVISLPRQGRLLEPGGRLSETVERVRDMLARQGQVPPDLRTDVLEPAPLRAVLGPMEMP